MKNLFTFETTRFPICPLLVLVVLAFCFPSTSRAELPNIVFIMVDDMGWADAGCYGSKAIQTPNLDRLANEGIRFTNAYAGHTVCAPSRCALMTARHTGHCTVRGNSGTKSILDEDITIPEVLKQAGYVTGGFGKWGLGTMGAEGAAEKQGFDTFFGYYDQVHAHTYLPPFLVKDGKPFPQPGNARLYVEKDRTYKRNSGQYKQFRKANPRSATFPLKSEEGDLQYSHYEIVEQMFRFIRENKDKPFFCYAPWTPPHSPRYVPDDEPAWQLYKDKPWGEQAKGHAAHVSMVDRHVGEIVDLLVELEIAEKTLVIFMSDNGASSRFDSELDSSGPLRGFKRSMHDGGIRSPLIAWWPGRIKPGVVSHHITYTPDMMPTFAELAGCEAHLPKDIDGISIAPTLLGNTSQQQKHKCLYWEWKQRGKDRAVRYGKWKLVSNDDGRWQLYDIETDISESNDVAKEHPDVIAEVDRWVLENRTEQ